jgi:ferrous iron transport protein B
MLLWDKTRDFLQKAFTIIFLASIVIWFLQTFNFRLDVVAEQQDSILATIASTITPIFKPLGFCDWRITTALASGFLAKESVVSTLEVLYSGTPIDSIFTLASGYSVLVFCLLYVPCVAAIASIRRELGTRWALSIVVLQCVIAWICAFIMYNLISLYSTL